METKPNHETVLNYGISDTIRTGGSSMPSDIARKHRTCDIVVRHYLVMYLGLTCEGISFLVMARVCVIAMRYFHWLSDPRFLLRMPHVDDINMCNVSNRSLPYVIV